ncbi:MAG: GNAT family N-acetyltransferase [Dysgonamonadaceae bacterium]|nr:GNAT family N-acetyltransferase [Dysgonamonadaceae bacterium]
MIIQHKIENNKQGSFFIEQNGNQIAELDYDLKNKILNAYHTSVRPELEGQGIAGKLFDELVKYARENEYKIIPSCSYILAKFKRNPEKFTDIWYRTDDEPTGDACGIKPK